MTMRRAADARFLINTFFVAFQEWDANAEAPEIDVSNSEGYLGNSNFTGGLSGTDENCRSYIPEIHRVQGLLRNASWDEENNIYLGPVAVKKGAYFTLSYFPSGVAGPAYGPWNCLCTRINHRGIIGQGAQPVTIHFTTDGESILECR
jgi:hypothetical protein